MQSRLAADEKALQELVERVVRERVAPRAAQIDREASFPADLRQLFAELGLFGLPFATEFGGVGARGLMSAIAIEEVAKACASSALMLAVHGVATLPLQLFGTPEQQQRFFPRMASGEWLGAFALSEVDAGSDPSGMRTSARPVDGGWLLSGQKCWITHAGVADFAVVFAVSEPGGGKRGISAFLIETSADGVSVGRLEEKMGMRGSPTGVIELDDVYVPEDCLVGQLGQGFAIAMAALDRSRLGIAAQALGIAQGATDYAIRYAQERHQFGQPISDFQAIQFKLADMSTRCEAGRELLYDACERVDRSHPGFGKNSAMAKMFCSDTAMANTTEAVQILGAAGYVRDHPVERMMRDAKVTQIYEGTNEIQRLVIAKALCLE